ncbi:MAG: thioesterase II family protein [Mastigocoleus sp. MO_167.B18]|uniref:thioesterase II family protein n=1 Tax=Mastigocoleus sp. MO_188.B34 TaxID=3036635 RepID=UPI00261BCD5B|nr:thioesterase II family protein [Mastigocoleus sp. MO_188.B34]MDJ0697135.1 thioesterase II family protein [Mastigocoleus sp. MO_188.B34]MDJ0772718.1 thioesterase II family protein [Mastigocoleus sp. MO_167.B18]
MNNRNQSINPWVICPKPNPHARVRLFCFHYAGGGTLSFRNWADDLFPGIEVYLIQLPGRERRLMESAFTRIEPLVKELKQAIIPYLEQPFALLGYSMGALLAFELARSLRRDRRKISPEHLFVCARRAPQIPATKKPIHKLSDPEFLQELRRLGGTPDEILANKELMELFIPTLRADFAVLETYNYYDEPPLNFPITAFGGSEDTEASREELAAWSLQTGADFNLHILPGDHFFLNSTRSGLLGIVDRICRQINV